MVGSYDGLTFNGHSDDIRNNLQPELLDSLSALLLGLGQLGIGGCSSSSSRGSNGSGWSGVRVSMVMGMIMGMVVVFCLLFLLDDIVGDLDNFRFRVSHFESEDERAKKGEERCKAEKFSALSKKPTQPLLSSFLGYLFFLFSRFFLIWTQSKT